jgi:hypothetical protein
MYPVLVLRGPEATLDANHGMAFTTFRSHKSGFGLYISPASRLHSHHNHTRRLENVNLDNHLNGSIA